MKEVRYGANGTYTQNVVSGRVKCTNTFFGKDPVPLVPAVFDSIGTPYIPLFYPWDKGAVIHYGAPGIGKFAHKTVDRPRRRGGTRTSTSTE